jgi:hypothetical protein
VSGNTPLPSSADPIRVSCDSWNTSTGACAPGRTTYETYRSCLTFPVDSHVWDAAYVDAQLVVSQT